MDPTTPNTDHDPVIAYAIRLRDIFDNMIRLQQAAGLGDLEAQWYLATPYAKYAHGRQAAWRHAVRIATSLAAAGFVVYSPIVHWHPISVASCGRIDGANNMFWSKVNALAMQASFGVIIPEMEGWRESEGIAGERGWFHQHKRPEIMLPMPPDEFSPVKPAEAVPHDHNSDHTGNKYD